MKLIFDTYSWIEYFLDSKEGKIVDSLLMDKRNIIITPTVVLVELCCKAEKEGWNFLNYYNFIKNNTQIIPLNFNIILNCGKHYVNIRKKIKDFGIIDNLIFTTAMEENARIVSGDKHFENFDNVLFLKEMI